MDSYHGKSHAVLQEGKTFGRVRCGFQSMYVVAFMWYFHGRSWRAGNARVPFFPQKIEVRNETMNSLDYVKKPVFIALRNTHPLHTGSFHEF